jgi:NNP family nitrate/nitrite transporter-like MFS transporter
MVGTRHRKRTPSAYVALIIATLVLLINFWAWSLLSPLGLRYADELGLSPASLSLLLAVPVIVGSLGRIVLGVATDKVGGRIMFAVASLAMTVPVIGLIFSNSYISLLFVAFVLGIGGATFVIGVPFVSNWFKPEKRGLALGLYSMGNAGTALSGFLTPRLADTIGRPATYVVVASLLVVAAVAMLRYTANSPTKQAILAKKQTGGLQQFVSVLTNRITWDLSAVYVISFGAFVAFGVYLPVLLKTSYALSLTDAATRAAGFILLATLARPLGGWLSDKIGGRTVIKLSLLATALLACFVAFQSNLQLHTTGAYLSLAATLGICNGAVFALVGKLSTTRNVGSMTGIVGALGGLGGFVPPLILGITYQKTYSYSLALCMLSLSALVVLVIINFRFKNQLYSGC